MRVCYFGAYDPLYPRNLILRRGLAANGVTVVECRASRRLGTLRRGQALAQQFKPIADEVDVILLAEFSQSLAPLAWWLAKRHRKTLVVDAFTSLYDSAVDDRGKAAAGSLSALRYRLIDWLAVHLPDHILVDTRQHADYFAEHMGADRDRLHIIPVGASREWWQQPALPKGEETLIQFYGTFIPLHGVETILRAAHLLRGRTDLRFELIGRGQTFAAMQALAAGLDNLTFCDPVPPETLPALVARADIALGIFGATAKAQRVVPNKVYQTLALGKPVITADTPAIRDAFTPGEHLLTVPTADPDALAGAITALAADSDRRRTLGEAGRAVMQTHFSEEALGQRLLEALA